MYIYDIINYRVDGDIMNYEEQILELKKRIEVLEKAEHKRIVKHRREIIFKIVKFLVIVSVITFGILFVYNNYVKPYKEKIDEYTEKIDSVESYVEDKLDMIQNWNPFS